MLNIKKYSHVVLKRHKQCQSVDSLVKFIRIHIMIVPFVFDLFYSNQLHLKMSYESESSRALTDKQEAIEAVVSYLSEEISDVVELDECVTQGVDECIFDKKFSMWPLFEDL